MTASRASDAGPVACGALQASRGLRSWEALSPLLGRQPRGDASTGLSPRGLARGPHASSTHVTHVHMAWSMPVGAHTTHRPFRTPTCPAHTSHTRAHTTHSPGSGSRVAARALSPRRMEQGLGEPGLQREAGPGPGRAASLGTHTEGPARRAGEGWARPPPLAEGPAAGDPDFDFLGPHLPSLQPGGVPPSVVTADAQRQPQGCGPGTWTWFWSWFWPSEAEVGPSNTPPPG